MAGFQLLECGINIECHRRADFKLGLGIIAGSVILDLLISKFVQPTQQVEVESLRVPLPKQEIRNRFDNYAIQALNTLKKKKGIMTVDEIMSMEFATFDMKGSFFGLSLIHI